MNRGGVFSQKMDTFKCPFLETSRLILRPLRITDAEAIFSLRAHPVVFKYVNAKPYNNLARARRFIQAVQKDIELEEAYFWGITLKENDYVIGTFCIWNFEEDKNKAEIGYELHPDYHKKGIMREAMHEFMHFIKSHQTFAVIDGITHFENIGAIKILTDFDFKCLGRAIDIDPEIDEDSSMMLYRLEIQKGQK